MQMKTCFMQGNIAMAQGAIDAGARFYAGYPITPSSEIAEYASRQMPLIGGIYIQMEDELASMAAIIGASASGKKSFTATSGPGFSLMQENLGVAIMAETPCVIINVQRCGPSTAIATKTAQADIQQCRWGTHGEHSMIALSPSSVEDCYYQTIRAFNLSEKYRSPVVILADETIGHLYERLDITRPSSKDLINRRMPSCSSDEYLPYDLEEENGIAPMAPYGGEYLVWLSGSMHNARGVSDAGAENADRYIRHYVDKIEDNKEDIVEIREFFMDDAEVAIIAYGCTARAAQQAVLDLREYNVKAGLLQLVTIWPFADKQIENACKRVKAVIVPELNLGQIAGEILKYNGDTPVYRLNRVDTVTIKPDMIFNRVKEVLECLR